MFERGYIILCGDPGWGTEVQAVAGERDTFFYNNAPPQVCFFYQCS